LQLFICKLEKVASTALFDSLKSSDVPEFAFCGRSNVGKSTLLNLISKSKPAVVSNSPGETKRIDVYTLQNKINFTDLPGYGFAYAHEEERRCWLHAVQRYLCERKNLRLIFALVDSRHGFKSIDKEFLNFLDR
jgi:GTP-binding protein